MALTQKAKGGTWYLNFLDPRLPHQKKTWKSCLTKDHATAQRIETEISTLSKNRDHWKAPEETGLYLSATLRIWGRKTHGAQAAAVQTRTEPSDLWLYGDRGQRQVFEIEGLSQQEAAEEIKRLLAALQIVEADRDQWRDRALKAEGHLEDQGKLHLLKNARLQYTLQTALDAWEKTLSGDADYVEDQKFSARIFVKKFGATSTLASMTGKEAEIDVWLRQLNVGAGRRKELRRVALRFLRDSGQRLDEKKIAVPSKKDITNDRAPIRWLDLNTAKAMSKALGKVSPYFQAAWNFQVATGLRPEEMVTVKARDFEKDLSTLVLSPHGELSLKEGPRRVPVSEGIRKAIKARLKENDFLFPFIIENENGRRKKLVGQPYPSADWFNRRYLEALKAAAAKCKIKMDVDCRLGRRTYATLNLAAGVPPHAVAANMGTSVAKLTEHYGAVIPTVAATATAGDLSKRKTETEDAQRLAARSHSVDSK